MGLSFKNGKFILTDKIPFYDTGSPFEWSHDKKTKSFSTTNVEAASRFQDIADKNAKYILKQRVQKINPQAGKSVVYPNHVTPMPFQLKGVEYSLQRNRSYKAHQPGLGKSMQFILSCNSIKADQYLVIAPSFLKFNWAREITMFSIIDFPRIEIVPETDKRFEMDWNAEFIICSDSMLQKSWVLEKLLRIKFGAIGIDEGHRFKSYEANRTKALYGGEIENFKSPGIVYPCEHIEVLSGTPMLHCPIDLWTTLFALAPNTIDFMDYTDFGFRYCGAHRNDRGNWLFNGSSNEEELHNRIIPRFMHRVRKKDVLKDLPDKIREIILIDKDTRKKDVVEFDEEVQKKLTRNPNFKPETLAEWAKFNHITGLAKVDWVCRYVDEILKFDDTEQIILFCHHRDVLEKALEKLKKYSPLKIYGGVSDSERLMIQDEFEKGKCRLLGGNIKAMNLGLTLNKATRICFLEYLGTPADNEQAEDRAHRIGQTKGVLMQYFVLMNSIDESRLRNIFKKEKSFNKVIEGK